MKRYSYYYEFYISQLVRYSSFGISDHNFQQLIICRIYMLYRWRWTFSNRRDHNPVFLFSETDLTIRLIIGFIISWASWRMQHVVDDMLTLPEYLITPHFLAGYVMLCLIYTVVCVHVCFTFPMVLSARVLDFWVWMSFYFFSKVCSHWLSCKIKRLSFTIQ